MAEEKVNLIDANANTFDFWAKKYDNDVLNNQGYIGHQLLFEVVIKNVPEKDIDKNWKILDIGCGTGLCGQEFFNNGFLNLYGGDVSLKMMELAKEKKIFKQVDELRLGEKLNFKDNTFNLQVAAGVFQPSGPHSSSLYEIFRICKIGGFIAFTWTSRCLYRLRETAYDEEVVFHNILSTFEKEGKLKKILESEEYPLETKIESSDMGYKIFIYQKLK